MSIIANENNLGKRPPFFVAQNSDVAAQGCTVLCRNGQFGKLKANKMNERTNEQTNPIFRLGVRLRLGRVKRIRI